MPARDGGIEFMTAVAKPRTWTITVVPPCAWLTGNVERYRYQRSSLVRQWREATVVACKAAKLPHGVSDVEVKGTVYYVGRRPVRDRLNLANTFKAIIDALTPHKVKWRGGKPVVSVGYGFLPDDDDRHVRSTTWELVPAKSIGRSTPAVVLTITDLSTPPPIDSHCHVVRDGDSIPCTARPGEPHVDGDGREYVTVPLNGKGADRG